MFLSFLQKKYKRKRCKQVKQYSFEQNKRI